MTLAAGVARADPRGARRVGAWAAEHAGLVAAAAMALVALATRAAQFGNPAIQMDEQFYLLVGDRMGSGALPYVDIWDRKPIGLFLIYAMLRPLSADGLLAVQLAATACAAATAWVVVRLASRVAGLAAALGAGAAYLVYLVPMGGAGGQSPVFYNLPIAVAALCVVEAGRPGVCDRRFARLALAAMGLAGLAMQIKYTAAVEGAAMGLWLLGLSWRRSGGDGRAVATAAVGWISIALAPTLAAWGAYIAMGHGAAFFHANVVSIFQVHEPAGFPSGRKLVRDGVMLAPLLLVSALGALQLGLRKAPGAPHGFLLVWAASAVLEFFLLGRFYGHYALPALAPLAVLCAGAMASPVTVAAALACFALWNPTVSHVSLNTRREATQATVKALVAAAAPYARQGCLYLNDGPVIVYLETHSCLPTPFVFPEHLNTAAESQAVDAPAAMRKLLANRPSAIFMADAPLEHPRNAVTAAMLDRALAAGYRRKAVLPDVIEGRRQVLYVRDDLR